MSDQNLQQARLTDQKKHGAPRFYASIGGVKVKQAESGGVAYMSVEDHVEMIGVAQVTFTVEGNSDWGAFEVGADVEIKVGDDARKMFVGYITGLRHSWQRGEQTLTVIAMDPLVKLASSRVTKVYEEVSDSDIVSSVLGDAGVQAGDVDSTPGTNEYVFQRNESNYNFLKRLAARNGYLLMANEGKIDFKKAQFSGNPVKIDRNMLQVLDYTINPVNVPKNLTTIGWDYRKKEKVEGTASAGDIQPIGGGTNVVSSNGDIWAGDSWISDVWVDSQAGAKNLSVGELNRLARGFIRGRAVVQGDATLYAGTKVELSGLPSKFNPTVFVVSSRHIMDPRAGYLTEFVFCGNTLPA